MPRLTGPISIATRAVKPLIAVALLITALVAVPTAASAAPAQTTAAVTSTVSVARSGAIASHEGVAAPNVTPPVFSCSYYSVGPFVTFYFTCTVQVGALRLYLQCSNGTRVDGPVMRAIGTYYPTLSCPGVPAQFIGWYAVP